MRVNRLVTKIVVRVFLILLIFATVPFFADKSKFKNIYFSFGHSWQLVFPSVIILSFIGLLLYCAYKKYSEPEINFLLVVNTIVLTAYAVAIFVRIAHLV